MGTEVLPRRPLTLAALMDLDSEKHVPPGATLAEAATRLTKDDALNWRGLVSDFVANDFVPAPAQVRSAMLAAPPPPSGSNRWDIFVCALAEHLAFHAEVDLPSWVDHDRTVTPYWWPVHGALPSQRAAAMGHSPASFRSRGILVDGREFPIVTR